jgi:hypothetical protein
MNAIWSRRLEGLLVMKAAGRLVEGWANGRIRAYEVERERDKVQKAGDGSEQETVSWRDKSLVARYPC